MKTYSLTLVRWRVALAWVELYTDGKPVCHQAYGVWFESRTDRPLFMWHCRPEVSR